MKSISLIFFFVSSVQAQDSLAFTLLEMQNNLDYLKAKTQVSKNLKTCSILNDSLIKINFQLKNELKLEKEKLNGLQSIIEKNNFVEIYFESNSFELSAQSIAILDHFISLHPEFKHIVLEGHADEQGNTSSNLKLSKERVEAAHTALLKTQKFGDKTFETNQFGSSQPKCINKANENCDFLNRRVTLRLVPDEKNP
jgi:OmpA-OmpF porin, OOP family